MFYVRAVRLARRLGDDWTLVSATAPHHLVLLLRLASGRSRVVEIGTGSGWGSAVLAIAEPRRSVRTFDPDDHGTRERYLALAGHSRTRIAINQRPGDQPDKLPADFLFIDSSHTLKDTIGEFEAWLPYLESDAIVVFHDYALPEVAAAIQAMRLDGEVVEGVYVWRKPPREP